MSNQSDTNSENLAIIKAIAILSVVAAHVDISNNVDLISRTVARFYYYFGSIGVGLFFIIAGRNFERNRFKGAKLERYIGMLIPWSLSGTFIYIYIYLRKGGGSIAYVDFLIGNGSYLYFMSIYFLFTGLSKVISYGWVRFALLIASGIYLGLGFRLMPPGVSEYLNVLLWIPYVIFGCYSSDEGVNSKFLEFSRTWGFILLFLLLGISIEWWLPERVSNLNYQSPTLIGFVCFIYLLIKRFPNIGIWPFLGGISRNTLFIYLWHMPMIGLLNFIANKYIVILHLFSPIIVIVVIGVIINLTKLGSKGRRMQRLLGIR